VSLVVASGPDEKVGGVPSVSPTSRGDQEKLAPTGFSSEIIRLGKENLSKGLIRGQWSVDVACASERVIRLRPVLVWLPLESLTMQFNFVRFEEIDRGVA